MRVFNAAATLIALAIAAAVMAFFMSLAPLHAREWGAAQGKYVSPSEAAWYKSLIQPDGSSSCCGAGDAYYADDSETIDGQLYAIITDTRPDTLTLDDGTKAYRTHVPVGTKVRIPKNKIRKHPVSNPTEHTVVFLQTYDGYDEWGDAPADAAPPPYGYGVYCFEPVGGL
jgi:hypothetical protein